MLYGIMSKLNFKCCQVEHVVFYEYKGDDTVIITANVDDMMIAVMSFATSKKNSVTYIGY